MKLASRLTALALFCASFAFASESATDCSTASGTLRAGLESQPERFLDLYLDALRTNPGCRKELFEEAFRAAGEDAELVGKIIFIARQEFPGEDTAFAEAALTIAPEQAGTIRDAFFAKVEPMQEVLDPPSDEASSAFVTLPDEARQLDNDIREAIARTTARLEGKLWPEQELSGEPVAYRSRDQIRTTVPDARESSLENAIAFDQFDERILGDAPAVILDKAVIDDSIQLDESKFSTKESDSLMAKEARKREIAPAGKVTVPDRPRLGRSSVYYIAPAGGDYRSTIDRDNQPRPPLVIRSAPASPTAPK